MQQPQVDAPSEFHHASVKQWNPNLQSMGHAHGIDLGKNTLQMEALIR